MINQLDPWVYSILADPISKQPIRPDDLPTEHGVLDARVLLKNTYGYSTWHEGQAEYEAAAQRSGPYEVYVEGRENVRCVYDHYKLSGRILDCGGGIGTLREFLRSDAQYVSIDPWFQVQESTPENLKRAFPSVTKPLNFIAATAEFLPFTGSSFDWVHMRSMLDHVQVVDLVLLEAHRVLRSDGKLLVGLYVEGGRSGIVPLSRRLKDSVKWGLELFGIKRWKDHHVWHPTYAGLLKVIEDNGFNITDAFWQPCWNDTVCYVCACKAG